LRRRVDQRGVNLVRHDGGAVSLGDDCDLFEFGACVHGSARIMRVAQQHRNPRGGLAPRSCQARIERVGVDAQLVSEKGLRDREASSAQV